MLSGHANIQAGHIPGILAINVRLISDKPKQIASKHETNNK